MSVQPYAAAAPAGEAPPADLPIAVVPELIAVRSGPGQAMPWAGRMDPKIAAAIAAIG